MSTLIVQDSLASWRCLQVVPGPLSARHSSVQGIPSSVTAGVPADFAIIPSDQYGNRGAAGGYLTGTLPRLAQAAAQRERWLRPWRL